jgi:sn-glycerol 3-phosphate transport system substrate-binding protein
MTERRQTRRSLGVRDDGRFGARRRAGACAAVLFTAGLAACGGSRAGAARADDLACPVRALSAGRPVTITVWESDDAVEDAALRALADAFNQTHPAVQVVIDHAGPFGTDPTGYLEGGGMAGVFLRAALDHQAVPDLVQLDGSAPARAAIDTGTVVPAQTCIDAAHASLSDFLPQALAETRVSDTQWGMPVGYDGIVGVYDATTLARAGLDPTKLPTTFGELANDARILAAHGVSHPLAGINLDPTVMLSGVAVTDGQNGYAARPTVATYNTAAARQIYDLAGPLIASGLLVPNVAFRPYNGALATFATGSTAFTDNPLDTAMLKEQVLPALAAGQAPNVTLAIGPVPSLTGPGGTGTWSYNWFLAAASPPLRRAAAWTFADWLEQPAQQARWHETTGYFPVRLSAARDPGVVALWRQQPTLAAIWQTITTEPWTVEPFMPAGPALPDPGQIDPRATADTAFAAAVAATNQSLNAYNSDPVRAARCFDAPPTPPCPWPPASP